MLSLAIVGLMVGLMIGRLTNPEPARLDNIEVHRDQLVLWFNDEPKVHAEVVEGTVAMLFDATGAPASGRLLVDGKPVTWRSVASAIDRLRMPMPIPASTRARMASGDDASSATRGEPVA